MLLWDSKGTPEPESTSLSAKKLLFFPAQLGRISGTKRSLDFTAVGTHTHTHTRVFLTGLRSYLIRVTVPALSGVPEPKVTKKKQTIQVSFQNSLLAHLPLSLSILWAKRWERKWNPSRQNLGILKKAK